MILVNELPSYSAMPRLGEAQRARLRQLAERCTGTVFWDKATTTVAPGTLVIVPEPIDALRAETLVDSLDETSVVVIPTGASPAFDPLKARLKAHGVIGTDGAASPHQFWWGGRRSLAPQTGIYRPDGIVLASCCLAGTQPDDTLARLRSEIDLFGLTGMVAELPRAEVGYGTWKIDFIIDQLDERDLPLLWLAPDVSVKRYPVLAQALDCDLAFHRRANGVVDPRVMVFRPTEATHALLQVWRKLSLACPDLPESFVFDQAWILTTAQTPLETASLPQSYCEADPTIRAATLRVPPVFDDTVICAGRYPRIAHRFGRPRAPEPALIMKSPEPRRQPVIVVISAHRDAPQGSACAALQSLASAFAADSGGFAQLELVLCEETAEMSQLMASYDEGWVVPAATDGYFPSDTFVRLAERTRAACSLDVSARGSVAGLFSAAISAQARWSQYGLGPFIRRPLQR
ncbi:hypothetical protein DU475_07180 [Rhodopseudomonas sp. WA056]|uniref:hypothetical protein n=1 Tax=Rhodopseudomonas sp. WA056 TaxID=2269367 RepID=UPI0013DFB988|nr:hypothetical protein [Rhodopseudomonas sp. WA056]NEW87044.1 hypothetical protein [Rhodopseudomonas sp. WA056]